MVARQRSQTRLFRMQIVYIINTLKDVEITSHTATGDRHASSPCRKKRRINKVLLVTTHVENRHVTSLLYLFLTCILHLFLFCLCVALPSVLLPTLSLLPRRTRLLSLALFSSFTSPLQFLLFLLHTCFLNLILLRLLLFRRLLRFTVLLFSLLPLLPLSSFFFSHSFSFCSSPAPFILKKFNKKFLHRSAERCVVQ